MSGSTKLLDKEVQINLRYQAILQIIYKEHSNAKTNSIVSLSGFLQERIYSKIETSSWLSTYQYLISVQCIDENQP